MRIDDELIENKDKFINFKEIDQNLSDIDNLISELDANTNLLRQRKNITKSNINTKNENARKNENANLNNLVYFSSYDINDIDYVTINIDVPNSYYLNQERQIVKYDFSPNILKFILVIYTILINVIKYINTFILIKNENKKKY